MTLKVLLSEEHPHSLVKRIIVFLFLPSILYAAGSWEGKVVGVSDGDAIKVLQDGKQVKIRLVSIDCPEKGQPSSRAAKDFISDLVARKVVKVQLTDTDRYGRIIQCITPSSDTCGNCYRSHVFHTFKISLFSEYPRIKPFLNYFNL